jgi:hypothetical protein
MVLQSSIETIAQFLILNHQLDIEAVISSRVAAVRMSDDAPALLDDLGNCLPDLLLIFTDYLVDPTAGITDLRFPFEFIENYHFSLN